MKASIEKGFAYDCENVKRCGKDFPNVGDKCHFGHKIVTSSRKFKKNSYLIIIINIYKKVKN